MWLAKAGAILVSGVQPPLLFEGAPPLFAVGLVGLYALLKGQPSALRTAGVSLAAIAIAAWLFSVLWQVGHGGLDSGTKDEFVMPTSLTLLVTALATIAGLVLLGLGLLKAKPVAYSPRGLPLALGLSYVPALIAGGALSSLNERYLEIPLALLAIGWMTFGYRLWTATRGQLGSQPSRATQTGHDPIGQ